MDIQNNSVVTDVDTEILDGEITQISNDFSETYYFDGEQEEELEMLVAKAMKLGELYERKKWQAAKAQVVPEGFILVPKEPTEAMIQRGTKANSECLNENAPLGERLFRHPALQVYQAMVNGSGE